MYAVSISLGCSSAFISVAQLPNTSNIKSLEDIQATLNNNNSSNNSSNNNSVSIPFRLVANATGHRSTPVVAALGDHEMLFGDVALHSYIREPAKVVPYLFGYAAATAAMARQKPEQGVSCVSSSERCSTQVASECEEESCSEKSDKKNLHVDAHENLQKDCIDKNKCVLSFQTESAVNDMSNQNVCSSDVVKDIDNDNTGLEKEKCCDNKCMESRHEYKNQSRKNEHQVAAANLLSVIEKSISYKYPGSSCLIKHQKTKFQSQDEYVEYGFECEPNYNECQDNNNSNETNNERFVLAEDLFVHFLNYIKAHVLDAACNLSKSDTANLSNANSTTNNANYNNNNNSNVSSTNRFTAKNSESGNSCYDNESKQRNNMINGNVQKYGKDGKNNKKNSYSDGDRKSDRKAAKGANDASHKGKAKYCSKSSDINFDDTDNIYDCEDDKDETKSIILTIVVPRYAFPESVISTPSSSPSSLSSFDHCNCEKAKDEAIDNEADKEKCANTSQVNVSHDHVQNLQICRTKSVEWLVEAVNASHLSQVTLHLSIVFSDEAAVLSYNMLCPSETLLCMSSYRQQLAMLYAESTCKAKVEGVNVKCSIDNDNSREKDKGNSCCDKPIMSSSRGEEWGSSTERAVIVVDWGVHVLSFSLMLVRDGLLLSFDDDARGYPFRCYTNLNLQQSSEMVSNVLVDQRKSCDECNEKQYMRHINTKSFCGGDEIDSALADTIAMQFMQKHHRQFKEFNKAITVSSQHSIRDAHNIAKAQLPARSMRKLRLLAGERKTALSLSASSSLNNVPIEVEAFYEGVDLLDTQSLNKNKFESAVRGEWGLTSFLQDCFQDYLSILQRTYLISLSNINEVILCGGMFKISALVSSIRQCIRTSSLLSESVKVIELSNANDGKTSGICIEADEVSCVGGCYNSYMVALAEVARRNTTRERKLMQRKSKKDAQRQRVCLAARWQALTSLITALTCPRNVLVSPNYISSVDDRNNFAIDNTYNNTIMNANFAAGNIYLFVGSAISEITRIQCQDHTFYIATADQCVRIVGKDHALPHREIVGSLTCKLNTKFALYLFTDVLPEQLVNNEVLTSNEELREVLHGDSNDKLILTSLQPFPYYWKFCKGNRRSAKISSHSGDKTVKTIALSCTTRVVKSNHNKKYTNVTEDIHDEIEHNRSEDVISLSHCLTNDNYEYKVCLEFSATSIPGHHKDDLKKSSSKESYSSANFLIDFVEREIAARCR